VIAASPIDDGVSGDDGPVCGQAVFDMPLLDSSRQLTLISGRTCRGSPLGAGARKTCHLGHERSGLQDRPNRDQQHKGGKRKSHRDLPTTPGRLGQHRFITRRALARFWNAPVGIRKTHISRD